ncbi:EpsG family protein [Candidatus Methylobacter favarea]|nr:EpsG family protein [Candidatus Methylobacter favarea]
MNSELTGGISAKTNPLENGQEKYLFFSLLISITYATILTYLPIDGFRDRDNYLIYAEYSLDIFQSHLDQGLGYTLVNEPLWLLINILLSFFLYPEDCVRVIVFFSSFVVSFVILRAYPKYFLLIFLFLLVPQVLKNHIIHLRQGMAIAVFLFGWFSKNTSIRWLFIILSSFIHSSFFFILVLLLLNNIFLMLSFSWGWLLFFYVLVGLFLDFAGAGLATHLGARQADELQSLEMKTSGLGFLLWLFFSGILILEGKNFMRRYSFSLFVLIVYLSGYFFLPVTARVFESTLLLVLISSLYLTSYRKLAFYGIFTFYFFFDWYQRLEWSAFGWGATS